MTVGFENRFKDKVAIVTGATRGIGATTVRRFAAEGARVVFCGRTSSDGQALVEEIGAERVVYVAADLSNPDECNAVVDTAIERFGRLDILVNNAASVLRGTLEDTTVEAFDRMIALNLRAPYVLMQRALPTFKAQFEREGVGGVVVNIGSINAYIGAPNLMAYSASKGGLMTLSRNLAGALGQWRVRVHVLNVGWTLTDGEKVVQKNQGAPEDWAERAGARKPWGRLLDPESIAAAITFYASDEAAMFSGAAIDLEQIPI
jgi:NAD(P)-dependent dehydrogenase (short-subunit alcohol dehydrogenase family)